MGQFIDITDDAIEAINKVFGKGTISIGENKLEVYCLLDVYKTLFFTF